MQLLELTFIDGDLLLRLGEARLGLIQTLRLRGVRVRLLILCDSLLCSLLLKILQVFPAKIAGTLMTRIQELFEFPLIKVLLDHVIVGLRSALGAQLEAD